MTEALALRAATGTGALALAGGVRSVTLDTPVPVGSPPAMATIAADVAMVKGETPAGEPDLAGFP